MQKQTETYTPRNKRKRYTLEIKVNAKRLYLKGLTITEISKIIDAPVRTIEKWRIAEHWKSERVISAIEKKAYDLYKSGKTQKEIAQILNKSVPTIGRYIRKAKNGINKNSNIIESKKEKLQSNSKSIFQSFIFYWLNSLKKFKIRFK